MSDDDGIKKLAVTLEGADPKQIRETMDALKKRLRGENDKKLCYCSFCGKSEHDVRKLVAGPNVFICNECVKLCSDIMQEGQ